MSENFKFHDVEIVGLFHQKEEINLLMHLKFSNEQKFIITFSSVVVWDLSPFEEQNVIFDIHEFNKENLLEWIKNDFQVPKEYIELINSGEKNLFYIEPSIGLGGYVVANKMLSKQSIKNLVI